MSKTVVFHLLTVNKRDRRVILCTWMYFLYLKVKAAAVVDFSLQPQRKKMFVLILRCVLSPPSATGTGVVRSWCPPKPPERSVAVNHSCLPDFASGFSAECLTHQLPRDRSKSRLNEWDFLVAFARLQFWLHFFQHHQPECRPPL